MTDEKFSLAVKSVVLAGAIALAIYGALKLRHRVLSSRRRYLDSLRREFDDADTVSKYERVAGLWKKFIRPRKDIPPVGSRYARSVVHITGKMDDDELAGHLEQNMGIKIGLVDDATAGRVGEENIRETEEIIDKFEHFGKLYEAGAIREKDVMLYFQTMLAHTFIGTLPYILYRRRGNPQYARKFQELVEVIPNIADVVSVSELLKEKMKTGKELL